MYTGLGFENNGQNRAVVFPLLSLNTKGCVGQCEVPPFLRDVSIKKEKKTPSDPCRSSCLFLKPRPMSRWFLFLLLLIISREWPRRRKGRLVGKKQNKGWAEFEVSSSSLLPPHFLLRPSPSTLCPWLSPSYNYFALAAFDLFAFFFVCLLCRIEGKEITQILHCGKKKVSLPQRAWTRPFFFTH